MKQGRRKPIHRGLLAARLYVALLGLILGLSLTALLAQEAQARSGAAAGEREGLRQKGKITIHYHGKTMETTSTGETVGELLEKLKLEVSGEDMVSQEMESVTRAGMVVRIDRITTRRETYSAVAVHGVSYCYDASLPEGKQEVLVAGSDGELLRTADVTYVNGVESRRIVRKETVTKAAVEEIVAIGTGAEGESQTPAEMPEIGDGYIRLATGEVLSYTRTATIRATAYTHTDEGCDFITATGTVVRRGTVAVDPRYIPYGTRMFIVASDGSYVYGLAVAEDCGGDIKGDRMDLYLPTYEECRAFGRRACTLYFLG